MTRTDVMASSRPQAVATGSKSRASSRGLRGLLALPIALLLAGALLLPSTALAATTTSKEGLSGYSKEAEPKSGTSPSKEKAPAKEAAPEAAASAPEKATTLPFTGFDLRWMVGAGLLMMGAGFSIVVVQRRQRRGSGR